MGQDMLSSSRRTGITPILFSSKFHFLLLFGFPKEIGAC